MERPFWKPLLSGALRLDSATGQSTTYEKDALGAGGLIPKLCRNKVSPIRQGSTEPEKYSAVLDSARNRLSIVRSPQDEIVSTKETPDHTTVITGVPVLGEKMYEPSKSV